MLKNKVNSLIKIIFISVTFISLIGCEEETGPITSNEMTIVVNSINQSDINDSGKIEKDENISNNTGNLWGEFIKEAEAECGSVPNKFEIVSLNIQLSDNEGVDVFEDAINGEAAVYFINTQGSDTDAIKVKVASGSNVTGLSSNELSNLASSGDLSVLTERLQGGDFHIGFSGATNLTKDDVFSFDVIIKFVVKAHCE